MKIAVASDGVNIAQHFGRCMCFIVFVVKNGQVADKEIRQNTFTAHALGQCNHTQDHAHEHTHLPIINALRDCSLVLCHGMGWRAAEELKQNGIQVAIVSEEMMPDEAVKRYISGELPASGGFCNCHD